MSAITVSPRRQPSNKDCMLTCLIMAIDCRLGRLVSIVSLRRKLRHDSYVKPLELIKLALKNGLSPQVFGKLELIELNVMQRSRVNFNHLDRVQNSALYFGNDNECLRHLIELIEKQRPVIAMLSFNTNNPSIAHAILVTSITTERVKYNDPKTGRCEHMNLNEFMERWSAYSCFGIACLIPSDK